MEKNHRFVFKNIHIAYIASIFSGAILLVVLHNNINHIILYGWFVLNIISVLVRIWLSRINLYPQDVLKNTKYRKIFLYIGITLSGLVWASSAWLLFPQDDIVRQMFLVFVLMGMTAGSPAASASSIFAFLCFSQPILLSLSLRFIYEGGNVFYIMAGLTQIHNISMIVTSINFTKIDKRFRKAKETAETANLAKSKFLANISHEVRTPMNAIVGLNYLLKQTTLTTQQLGFVDKSLVASNSLLGSIENILDYSKIEQKKFDLEISPFHLDTVLNTVTTLVELDANKKGLKFTSHITKDTTTHLLGDSFKLVQILRNLAENAVKFTEKGEVELTITQIELTDKKVLIHFSIRDTGIGIYYQDHDKLFKSFSQVNTSYSRQYGGTGLGLSISQQLANLMGSEIEFESEPNKGSTFYFSIWFESYQENIKGDIKEDHEVDNIEQQQPSLIALDPHIAPTFTGHTILLVEDDELNQLVAKELLKHLGIQVAIADTAQQAFEILDKNLPDLVLLDLQLPLVDGYETINIIRATHKWKHLPVICLTAHSSSNEKQKALASGMNDFLTKPIDPIELQNMLQQWLPSKMNENTNELSQQDSSADSLRNNHSQLEITQNILNVRNMLKNKQTSMSFFKTAVSSLTASSNKLQQHLINNNWKQASLCAHQLRGTANFYASSALQQCLQNIDDELINEQNKEETLNLINTEFGWVIDLINKNMRW